MFWQLCTVLWITWRLLEGVEHCGRNSGVEKEKDHNDGRYYSALFQITFKHFFSWSIISDRTFFNRQRSIVQEVGNFEDCLPDSNASEYDHYWCESLHNQFLKEDTSQTVPVFFISCITFIKETVNREELGGRIWYRLGWGKELLKNWGPWKVERGCDCEELEVISEDPEEYRQIVLFLTCPLNVWSYKEDEEKYK